MPITQHLDLLKINTDLAHRLLVEFIRDEVSRAGFKRAVLGISGGVDSALAAYLTVEALGAENVLGLRMPYKTSSPQSFDDAGLVIEALGIQHEAVDITPMVDPLIEKTPNMTAARAGNIMARQRMIVLYDRSAAFGGLVVGTGNKTEALLGYTTHFGDNAAALHPLGDLYKNQVRQVARRVGVPEAIIAKPPSADLWPGQTDEGELGYSYDEVDQLLYLLFDLRYRVDEAVEAGFPRPFVEKVCKTVRQNHYKRRTPLIPKLSQRTIGIDFLYLRDWGT